MEKEFNGENLKGKRKKMYELRRKSGKSEPRKKNIRLPFL